MGRVKSVFLHLFPVDGHGRPIVECELIFQPSLHRLTGRAFLQDIEEDLVQGNNIYLPRVMQRLLYTLSYDRKVT